MLGRVLSNVFGLKPAAPPQAAGVPADNPLAEYFFRNSGRLIHKWHHYLEVYHRHFAPFRGRAPVVLEIGVSHGGSLAMWHRYFGAGTKVVGVDFDERCRAFADENTTIVIGDQADRSFLATLRERVPHVDILIDDGGHTMEQQAATFEALYPHVQPNGLYVCEDMHTSYHPKWGGGLRREGSFVETAKGLVDRLNAWHSVEPDRLAPDGFTCSAFALHFYLGMLVIEKRPIAAPVHSKTGVPSF